MPTPFATKEEIEDYMNLVGNRLAKIRHTLGLSQYNIAETIGCTQNPIFRMENGFKGTSTVTMSVLLLYFTKFNVNPAWVFSKDNTGMPLFVEEKTNLEIAIEKIMTEFYSSLAEKNPQEQKSQKKSGK